MVLTAEVGSRDFSCKMRCVGIILASLGFFLYVLGFISHLKAICNHKLESRLHSPFGAGKERGSGNW